jgi:serine/threonine protein kinase
VIHRDLKPDNLLCTPTDREYPLRVLDWGVARLGPSGRLTLDGLTPGTPIYMSPEQATGRNIGPACDLYALGVIAYEALTGEPPFDGRTLAEVVCMHLTSTPRPLRQVCNAPPALCELVERMLGKDPANRPTATEARALARAIADDLSPAYEEIEIISDQPATPRCRTIRAAANIGGLAAGSFEGGVVDADALENGSTEMLPVMAKPRWTPEIGRVPATLTIRHGRRPIAVSKNR